MNAMAALGAGVVAGVTRVHPGAGLPATGGFGWKLLQTAAVLALVSLLAYVSIRLVLRRWSRASGSASRLEVLDRLWLEPKRSLQVVRVGSRVFLIGLGEGGPTTLAELDADEWPVDAGVERPSFARVLERVLRRRDPSHRLGECGVVPTAATSMASTSAAPLEPKSSSTCYSTTVAISNPSAPRTPRRETLATSELRRSLLGGPEGPVDCVEPPALPDEAGSRS